jgi:hypothetical protein
MHMSRLIASGSFCAMVGLFAGPALADCSALPAQAALKTALVNATFNLGANGGFGFNMWGTIVDNSGIVCAVAFTGANFTSQWLGSRVISAQKANTGNAFSLCKGCTPGTSAVSTSGLAISTANLFSAVQPGGSLYGLQHSNPVDTEVGYGNPAPGQNPPKSAATFGTTGDPMVGDRIGGVNVFGGGLGLYRGGVKVGGLGVSGDTSCTDHMVAWRTRHALNLDQFQGVTGPAKVFAGDTTHPDNIIYDIAPNPNGGTGNSKSGFGHPTCFQTADPSTLPAVQ